jgi:hypothetical protein
MFFSSFALYNARISALVIVLSDSPCERTGNLSNFERRQIIGAHLAGAPMTKTATLLGISRAIVF